jgi:catechol 2,3-dioxygenase-like lactoylglutathione lyase family enzyme
VPLLNHLHLHVRDVEASRAFYERWFGLREHVRHGEIVFVRDASGFDLALAPDPSPAPLPAWFHLGFRLGTPVEVRGLHQRLGGALGSRVSELLDEPDFVQFRVADPDGYKIEVYWE